LPSETVVVDNDDEPEIWSENMEALVLGAVEDSGDENAIKLGFTNITDHLTDNTKVLILEDLKDEYIDVMNSVLFENEGFVFINTPEKSNIEEYDDELPFFIDQVNFENLDMLGFCMEGALFQNYVNEDDNLTIEPTEVVKTEKTATGDETSKEEIDYGSEEEYNPVYDTEEWFSYQDATEWIDLVELERASTDPVAQSRRAALAKAAATRAAVGEVVKDVNTLQGIPYSTNFKIKYKFTYCGELVHECYIMGDASYSVRPFYIYGGQSSSGDYYVVKAHYTWNNSSAYRGEFRFNGWNALGAVPYYCEFLTTPIMKDGYTCIIPAEGSVKPENVNKETKITDERSFTLSAKGTVGTKTGVEDGKTKTSASKGLEVSAEWGWKTSKETTQYNWDIYRVGGGNQAGHKLVINTADLPERRTGVFRMGYNNVKNDLLGSTFDVSSTWMWYVPETKTDSEVVPLSIQCEFKPYYVFHLNGWWTSEDMRYDFYGGHKDLFTHVIKLLPTNRINAGILELKNTFTDKTISSIEITDATTGKVVDKSDGTTVQSGKSIKFTLPATDKKYNITFKAGTTAANSKKYKNTDVITLAGLGDVTPISSDYAFQEVAE